MFSKSKLKSPVTCYNGEYKEGRVHTEYKCMVNSGLDNQNSTVTWDDMVIFINFYYCTEYSKEKDSIPQCSIC